MEQAEVLALQTDKTSSFALECDPESRWKHVQQVPQRFLHFKSGNSSAKLTQHPTLQYAKQHASSFKKEGSEFSALLASVEVRQTEEYRISGG